MSTTRPRVTPHHSLDIPSRTMATMSAALHPMQLRPYRTPATAALRIRLKGSGPCSAHSSRQRAWLARLIGLTEYIPARARATPTTMGWSGSGPGRYVLREPDQTGEPGPLPRAVRTAWAAALQPDAERCGRGCALRPQLHGMQRGAHGGHGAARDVQSVVGGDPEPCRPRLQVRPSAAHAI